MLEPSRCAGWLLAGCLFLAACSPVGLEPDGGEALDAGPVADGGPVGDAGLDAGTTSDAGPTPDAGLSLSDRQAAVAATATTNALCTTIAPFYWEIGDTSGALGSGSIMGDADGGVVLGDTVMPIASASKWLYSTYYAQKVQGALTADDIQFFNFWSGYTNFTACPNNSTVGTCLDKQNPDGTTNGQLDPSTVGKFSYGGGHMQKHAALHGLDGMANGPLAAEIRSQLGAGVSLAYVQPQLAGGVATSANEYAKVLRGILSGGLAMHDLLGTHAVCTNPNTCSLALSSPLSGPGRNANFHYSIGHWVEDDPLISDGAFSSAGSFGFYPWIDSTKTLYGVIARLDTRGSGFASMDCGHLLRHAWATGAPQ